MMTVTVRDLKRLGACADQVALFAKHYPHGWRPTEASIRKALCLGLNVEWHALLVLPAPAREAYKKAAAPAREAYEKATAQAREAYEKAAAQAREAYKKATAPAWEAYEKAAAPLLEAYKKALATALAMAYKEVGR